MLAWMTYESMAVGLDPVEYVSPVLYEIPNDFTLSLVV